MIPVTAADSGAVLFYLPGWLVAQFLAATVVTWASWHDDGKLAESLRTVLLPVAIGQFGVLAMTAVFQLWDDGDFLLDLDNWLNRFYARHHHLFVLRFWMLLIIVIALVALNMRFGRRRFVTRFFSAQRYFNMFVATIATIASVTFAAQDSYAMRDPRAATVAPRPVDPDKETEVKKLNRISAPALARAFASMPAADLRRYADVARSIDRDVRWTRQRDVWRQILDQVLAADGPPFEPAVPATAAQPRPADNAHDEAWLATKELFVAAMSSMVPGSEDLAGRCFDEGVGLLSEKLFDLGFRDSTRIQVDAAVAKLVDWLRPRLATLAGLSSAAGGPEKLVDESRRAVEQKIAVDLRRAHPPPTAAERRLNDRLRDSTKPGGER